jgi:hypothetical protein
LCEPDAIKVHNLLIGIRQEPEPSGMQCEKSVNLLVRLQPICWFETLSAAGTQLRDRRRKTM